MKKAPKSEKIFFEDKVRKDRFYFNVYEEKDLKFLGSKAIK